MSKENVVESIVLALQTAKAEARIPQFVIYLGRKECDELAYYAKTKVRAFEARKLQNQFYGHEVVKVDQESYLHVAVKYV